MSVVSLQVGQCGNQLGSCLFSTLWSESGSAEAKDAYFRSSMGGTPVARCVLVDTEPRVISAAVQHARATGAWRYSSAGSCCHQSGAANNWAFGYYSHGAAMWESVEERVRCEVEHCDRLGGFFAMHSLAGGTGSGVGTFITQALRDEYQSSFILNGVVWPYDSGEVTVQNYNATLTLAKIYDHSDGIIVERNNDISRACSRLLGIKSPSFMNLNQMISDHLASVLLPVSRQESWCGHDTVISSILEQLCAHPAYRLLNIKSIPQMAGNSIQYSSFLWAGLLKHLHQMLIADGFMEEGVNWEMTTESSARNKSVANRLVLRGHEWRECDVAQFASAALYPCWAYEPLRVVGLSKPFRGHPKSATLLSNSQSLLEPLDRLLAKTMPMFDAKAYLHQYSKFGLESADMCAALARLEQVVSDYGNL